MAKGRHSLTCDIQSKVIHAHKPCLEKLRNTWREALVQVKAKKKSVNAGDEDALQVIEKTLQGASCCCCFGNHIFAFKQASFTLLQLLRLLPEPSEDFTRLVVQLLVQLAKQDRHAVLSNFVGDCEAALDALRRQPLKINAFQRLNQLCKERLAAEANLPEKAAGLSWDLGSVDRLCCAAQRLVQLCGCLGTLAIEAASMEALQISLLRLGNAALAWEDSAQLLTVLLEALAKLRGKDLNSASICLQHELAAFVVPVLRAGLKSNSPALRSSSSQLAIDALQMEEDLLWPHLPALVRTMLECEAPPELLATVAKLGSKLQPALRPDQTRWLQLLDDPCRCLSVLRLLPYFDLAKAPQSVQRLQRILSGDVTAGRAALADEPNLEVLHAIRLHGGSELQAEGEKLLLKILEEVPRGKVRSWQRLMLCLETFTEAGKPSPGLWQKLLQSASGPGRLAVWTALARWLQGAALLPVEEPNRQRLVQMVLKELSKDAVRCSDPSLRVCLCYVLVLCFTPCLLDGNVGDSKKLPVLEALDRSPFCRSMALLSLPSAFVSNRPQKVHAENAKECQFVKKGSEGLQLLPLPCALCKSPVRGKVQCQCGAKLLTLDWSFLDGSLLDSWSSLRMPASKGQGRWLKHPEELLRLILQLRSNLGDHSPNGPYCLLEPNDSQEVVDMQMSEELQWLLAWSFLGLCCSSSRDFLAAKSQEIIAFFPWELAAKDPRNAPWDASRVNCHAALLQCRDFVSTLFREAEESRCRKRFCDQGNAAPAVLAQNIAGVLPLLVQDACRFDKASLSALQRVLGISILSTAGIDTLIQNIDCNIGVQLLGRYQDVRVANLCQLVLQGPMKFRMRRLLSKTVPKMVLEQKMENIKELMQFFGKELMPAFLTPLLPYVLSEVAEEKVGRIAASFRFLEKVYEHKLTINDICDAHWGTVLVRILWNSDRCPEAERCRQAKARIQQLAEALPQKNQDSKKREAPEKGAVVKKRRGEKNIIDVTGSECVPKIAGLTESGFLHALDILQIVISDSREHPKWQEYHQLLEDPFASTSEVPLDVPRFLRSSAVLLEVLGEDLHRFAVKIFELLQSACARVRNADSLRCWKLFLRIGLTRLKPVMPALVSELLQLAVSLQDVDTESFQELQKLLSSVVLETSNHPEVLLALPPLPEYLRGSKHHVEKVLAKMGVQHRIESTVKQLEVSNQAVRHAILQGLLHFLTQQRQAFSKVAGLPSDILAKLMRILLKFLSESASSPGSQLLCGQVLGALGAIDPAHFPGQVLVERHNPAKDLRSLKGDHELAKSVLEDFLAPNLTDNSVAFAAQEVFKYFQNNGKEQIVFNKLSEDAKAALNPYRSSKYESLGAGHGSDASFEGVLADATALLPPERKALFEAFLPATAGNHALALFLMHHVVHELIVGAPQENRSAKLSKLAQQLAQLLNSEGKDPPDSQETATAQAVFSLLDDLIQKKEEISAMPSKSSGDETWKNRQIERIGELCKPFSYRSVLRCAVRCGAHARALQFLEMELVEATEGKTSFDEGCRLGEEDCELLQMIYRELGEPDGVVGAIRIGPHARTRTSELELQGKWSDMQASYEEIASTDCRSSALCGLVNCTQAMRRFESSLQLISGIQQELPDLTEKLRPRSVEAAWQLSSWDRLADALQAPQDQITTKDFQVQLGDILLQLHERNEVKVEQRLQEATMEVARSASLAARDSYTRAYQHLLCLHVLSDLHWLSQRRQEGGIAKNLLERCDVSRPSFNARQALLGPLKVALQDLNLRDEAKTVELAFSRLCRKHGEPVSMQHPDSSFKGTSSAILASAQLEWGKILYASGARHDALRHMQRLSSSCPRAQLLGARWAADASLLLPRVAEAEFQQAKERLNNEAAFFYHASYLDYLLKSQISEVAKGVSQTAPAGKKARTAQHAPFDRKNLVTFTFRGYLQALQRGTKRLHFILNRLLQLAWECCEVDLHKQEMVAEFQREAAKMPAWMWYSVLSQLISRALHPDLRKTFSDIIKSVTKECPQQAAWHLVQLLKSQKDDRSHAELGQDIVGEVGRQQPELHRLLITRMKIAEDFGKLASTTGDSIQFSRDFPRLVGSGSRAERWEVLVPLQSQMTARIPRQDGAGLRNAKAKDFFPEVILSERCLEQVEVFRSKEKPKKVIFLGTDGRHYPFLCKAEKRGDLRKDSRLMEFAAMVNQLLAKSPDANRRNLEVRTFHVVIISEKCGLLEWVPNTKGLRHVIDDLWKSRKHARPHLTEIKDIFDRSKDFYETFTKQVLPRHPPVLHKWFLKCGDPSMWFAKRVLFSQSQALWSMLGYLVGLGDRHGENILLDTDSGRLVHVDFDCLFGKGMLLDRPEMVPFRLTQNCVAAMGITGVEGIFRQCGEVTMEVLRDRGNTQTLLSVLHVFVADPLLEITRKVAASEMAEHRVQTARDTINEVEKKLKGMLNVGAAVEPSKDNRDSVISKDERKQSVLGRDRGVGLSVKGQVDELIKAATCKRNLSEMYVGWQPWL